MGRTVFIEDSKTPIYRRIATALGGELVRCGFDVLMVKPEGFNSDSFREFVAGQGAAMYVSNSVRNVIQGRVADTEHYFFEHFPGKLIFLHQDAILGGFGILDAISRLNAWKRVAHRSAHLCIEPEHVAELAAVGVPHAQWVPHATEIEPQEPSIDEFEYGTTFVGHAIPSMYRPVDESPRVRGLVEDALTLRRGDFGAPLQPLVRAVVDGAVGGLGTASDQAILKLAHGQWLRSQITNQSMPMRGWLFENCGTLPLDIFGGDPAYLHGVARSLQVDRPGVSYHAAVYDPVEVQRLFRTSRVNLNFSSLQFDHAVVNRFHDVTMAGGLCLTEHRSGLEELTSAHADVAYRTLDDLQDRMRYFSRPENARQRALLIKALQKDVARNSGYPLLAQVIVDAAAAM